MNTIAKKTLLIGFVLLLSACVHYPQQQYSYYPSTRGYSSGYTIMHRNYYGERPDHYQRGHGRADYSHHNRHNQYNTIPRRGSNYQNRQQQRNRSNSSSNNRHNNANRRNHD